MVVYEYFINIAAAQNMVIKTYLTTKPTGAYYWYAKVAQFE